MKQLIDRYWFSPQDIIFRSIEAKVWADQKFKRPVLDIGCGDGGISEIVFSHQIPLDVGVDNNPLVIARAKSRKIYHQVLLADAIKLPFKANTFSTVVSNSTFEHIPCDLKAVAEVSRVLRKSGNFIFTVPLPQFGKMVPKSVNDRLSHFHYRSLREWKKLLAARNMFVVESKYYFPKLAMNKWYRLFSIFTYRLFNKRELWSYLSDPRFEPFLPKQIIKSFWHYYLRTNNIYANPRDACWLFIAARKN
ncbi:MAG: class I SAM-dependent methyltransferase [Patescibacteria group bacterium]